MFNLRPRKPDLLAIILIFIVVIAFFFKLFYPQPQIFVTPDFGLSDIFSANMPVKYIVFKAFHANSLPLWEKNISTGFPALAMGLGTFNLANLVLFRLNDFVLAYNLTYLIIFATAGIGTYLYLRILKFTSLLSLFGALTFAFSGPFITQIPHTNVIESASFIPLIFLSTYLLSKKVNRIWVIFLAFFFSQQLFSDFMQIAVITFFGISIYFIFLLYKSRQNWSKKILFFFFAIFLGSLLYSIQLLPTIELIKSTVREKGFSQGIATYFSYPPVHLKTLLNPYALGHPALGSYPPFFKSDGSIFWENTGYIGILALLFSFFSIFMVRKKFHVRFYLFLLIISFLMMTGKYSPLYFVHSFPPLSFFRVPSRFIFLFVWSLTILSVFGLQVIKDFIPKKVPSIISTAVLVILILISFFDLFKFGLNYNPVGLASAWLKTPPVAKYLQQKKGRYYTLGSKDEWNAVFIKMGWQKDLEPFRFFQNSLSPDINILYDLSSFQTNQILMTRRFGAVADIIAEGISDASIKLLRLYGVFYIISTKKPGDLPKIYETKKSGDTSFGIYEVKDPLPRAFLTFRASKIDTLEEFRRRIANPEYDPLSEVLLEKEVSSSEVVATGLDSLPPGKIKWLNDKSEDILLEASSPRASWLILSDSYYPGWRAYVDQKPVEIIPANLNQRAIKLAGGRHLVRFVFEPDSFKRGLFLTIFGIIITVFVILFPFFSPLFAKFSRFRRPSSHP